MALRGPADGIPGYVGFRAEPSLKTRETCNIVMPFQTIEQVDEPRMEKGKQDQDSGSGEWFDPRERQIGGLSDKLIWGDNILILSSLKNGLTRDEFERQGELELICVDPPLISESTSRWTSRWATHTALRRADLLSQKIDYLPLARRA
jgi:hypothetical protein